MLIPDTEAVNKLPKFTESSTSPLGLNRDSNQITNTLSVPSCLGSNSPHRGILMDICILGNKK